MTRDQAEKMARECHGHEIRDGRHYIDRRQGHELWVEQCVPCDKVADALQKVAGSEDTRLLNIATHALLAINNEDRDLVDASQCRYCKVVAGHWEHCPSRIAAKALAQITVGRAAIESGKERG